MIDIIAVPLPILSSSSSRLLCLPVSGTPLKVRVATRPACRIRSSLEDARRLSSGVSNTVLTSKTRGRDTTKPASRSRRRVDRASFTASLISVSWLAFDMGWSLRAVALMVIEKVLVDGLTTAEAFVHAMPEGNAALAKFPAQVDLHAAEQGREVHQADIQIFHQATRFQNRLNAFAQARGRVVAARPGFERTVPVHDHAAHHHHVLAEFANHPFGILVFSLRIERLTEQPVHLGNQALGFHQRKAFGHVAPIIPTGPAPA